jgi:hypothetical protein
MVVNYADLAQLDFPEFSNPNPKTAIPKNRFQPKVQ